MNGTVVAIDNQFLQKTEISLNIGRKASIGRKNGEEWWWDAPLLAVPPYYSSSYRDMVVLVYICKKKVGESIKI